MSPITIISDNGLTDYYTAAIKAKVIGINPNATLIEITHAISLGDVAHAAFVLDAVFRDFPLGSVHLATVDAASAKRFIGVKLEGHYFVSPDNGLLSLISVGKDIEAVDLNYLHPKATTFPEKDILAIAAARLANGESLSRIGSPLSLYQIKINRQLRCTKNSIAGNVVHVDNYGNLITNITQTIFEEIRSERRFVIRCGGKKLYQLNTDYFDVEPSECFAVFNSLHLLEIGIYRCHAATLAGLNLDSAVTIFFE